MAAAATRARTSCRSSRPNSSRSPCNGGAGGRRRSPSVSDRLHGQGYPPAAAYNIWVCIVNPFAVAAGRIAEPVARPGAEAGGAIVGIGELAAVEREAAAADALGEARLQALQLGDPLVDAAAPGGGEPRPVRRVGDTVRGQLGELGGDLVEGEADPLGEDDEGDPAQHRARVAAVAGALALGARSGRALRRSGAPRRRRRCAARSRRW